MRARVDAGSAALHAEGQRILDWLTDAYGGHGQGTRVPSAAQFPEEQPFLTCRPVPYQGLESLQALYSAGMPPGLAEEANWFGVLSTPIPYHEFKRRLTEHEA
jgi:hypothetical protein